MMTASYITAAYLVISTPGDRVYESAWKSISSRTAFVSFSVRAPNDVRLVLSRDYGQLEDTWTDLYELIVDGWTTAKTSALLRVRQVTETDADVDGDDVKATYAATGLVGAGELKHFWVSWNGGVISVSIATC